MDFEGMLVRQTGQRSRNYITVKDRCVSERRHPDGYNSVKIARFRLKAALMLSCCGRMAAFET